MALGADDIERARGWLDAVEAALVARALGDASAAHGLAADDAAAGLAAVAAKFLAVGTPRTYALVGAGPRAAALLAAQCAYATPRELRIWEPEEAYAQLRSNQLRGDRLAARPSSLREACACDIVVIAAAVEVHRAWLRAGTLVVVLDRDAALDRSLLAAAHVFLLDERARADRAHAGVHVHATLAAAAAGLVDGRQLDEVIVLLP
jgi:ornithine cyclodeaminase/alanine dehydrogenase-like protein (mu-crystallin family)